MTSRRMKCINRCKRTYPKRAGRRRRYRKAYGVGLVLVSARKRCPPGYKTIGRYKGRRQCQRMRG